MPLPRRSGEVSPVGTFGQGQIRRGRNPALISGVGIGRYADCRQASRSEYYGALPRMACARICIHVAGGVRVVAVFLVGTSLVLVLVIVLVDLPL